MKANQIILFFLIAATMLLAAWGKGYSQEWSYATIVDGDTFAMNYLPYHNVTAERKFMSKKEELEWKRLKKNVKKVYPYAKLAGQKMQAYAEELATVENERERKKYYKKIEEELKAEFDDDIRDMTMTQGRILIRLIDRETGNTSYDIVKDLRGSFSAFFWQSLAKIFTQDLKARYDPTQGEDAKIEQVIFLIESGQL